MSPRLIAHSSNDTGETHSLADHLRAVADRASCYAFSESMQGAAHWAGIWHDLGKVKIEFQEKLLNESRKCVPHKYEGAFYAYQSGWHDVAFAIAGHHGGLPSKADLNPAMRMNGQDASRLVDRLLSEIDVRCFTRGDHSHLPLHPTTALDLHIRMLFSCLIDADFLDTERHFDVERKGDIRAETNYPDISQLKERFFLNHAEFLTTKAKEFGLEPSLFDLRNKVFDASCRAGESASSQFSLTVPTGGGKTRAALVFALTHAVAHNKKRIIVALPFTSILDQMADEYREIFGVEAFLEHYTGAGSYVESAEGTESIEETRRRLAAENWDAPIILTTTVQLFDSLFANSTSACRKLHNIAGSIIILDEVQTLPVGFLDPICDVLKQLTESYGVTLLLSSATQPALDSIKSAYRLTPTPIIDKPERLYQKLRRVRYEVEISEPWSWERVAEEMMANEQAMTIVNTRADSLKLFECLNERGGSALYLSTYLCGAHRRKVIEKIKTLLKEGRPCRLVTTQIVEAGVDIDFPLVLRAVGPLDRIVQAAGRCNREGRLGERGGRMIVFQPAEGRMPRGVFETGAGAFVSIFRRNAFDPDDPKTFPDYFSELYILQGSKGLDAKKIQELRDQRVLNFPEVAAKFSIIEDDWKESVVVGYGDQSADERVRQVQEKSAREPRRIFSALQPYTAELYQHQVEKARRNGLVVELDGILCWMGKYDSLVGIARIEQNPESHIL
ncbi:MAG: CRISPR-associated helicase Cas3' [Calditrichaeota bacterium]|nr:CRISPR-associated helicase Cas3' [Calditrichota bacterium]